MNKTLLLWIALITGLLSSCEHDKYPHGKQIYEHYCSNCHMNDGKGLGELYPSIDESAYLRSELASLPCLIRHGKKSAVLHTVYMPAHKELTELEMNNLVNYLSDRWGEGAPLSLDEVTSTLLSCP